MNTPVLIMSALPEELASLEEQTSDCATITFGGHDFLTGMIDSRDVVVAAGIGKVNAAMVATLAIDHFSPSALIFTGVAGGIDDTLGIGDVVVAEHVLHHDTGVLEPDGFRLYQSGHVPFLNLPSSSATGPPTNCSGAYGSDSLTSNSPRFCRDSQTSCSGPW